ncbi:alpha-N-acetylglucosaminidase [Bacteroides pyogenes JCM 10003]|nr:alpha-N-acetylglucosaminidase [Bacteroides pyogenes JCM 10003]
MILFYYFYFMTRIYCFLLISLTCLPLSALSDEAVVVTNLAKRLIPEYTAYFCFSQEKKEDGKDSFTLESKDGKILIRGNSANSMAVALNYYLKYYCKTTVSWYADIPVEMPEVLPIIPHPIRKEAKVERRFFLNYCTYGYTMPFWKWSDWERLIDWMALNGVNMPLAITGQEAVWYKVWSKLGLTDEEIRSYFTGPTYLPWHRMANIDGWNGPLPKHWLDTQVELQKKILARERELNMRPVLPAFAGHVPEP